MQNGIPVGMEWRDVLNGRAGGVGLGRGMLECDLGVLERKRAEVP